MNRTFTLALVLLGVIAVQTAGFCQDYVILANKVAAKITAPGPFNSIFDRVAYIDKQVSQAISVEDVGRPKMYIMPGKEPAIFIGKTLLTRVYPADVAGRGVTQMDLAKSWKANFEKLFPLAEPCIRMGRGKPAAASTTPSYTPPPVSPPAAVCVPTQDWAMVAVLLDHLLSARACDSAGFQAELPNLVARVYDDILQGMINSAQGKALSTPPHEPGKCPQGGQCPGCRKAKEEAIARPVIEGAEYPCVVATNLEDIPGVARRRIESGLKLMHSADDARYQRDRIMVAKTVLDVVRKEVKLPEAAE